MPQDIHQRAKERYEDAKEAYRSQHERMREDLRFSNPSDPQQWPQNVQDLRKGRVCLTLDRTNQYIVQVVNDARKNKPGITTMPADSGADIDVAKRLDGIIRHIEYRSRAQIAYDTAIEHSARCGLGWIRVVPEIVRAETNQQEISIKRVHDPLSIVIDPDSTEPDGSDAMDGWAETLMSKRAFKAAFPKAKADSWESDTSGYGWATEESVRVCEYQYVVETTTTMVTAIDSEGGELDLTEDDYWKLAKQLGYSPQVVTGSNGEPVKKKATDRKVKWCKLSGVEVLEETDFPSKWIGFIPVIGFELFVDNKRFLCGLTRRMMDAQRSYNYERSALVEAVALQPKAPILVDGEAIAGYEQHWDTLNQGSPAFLPHNSVNADGQPIPPPSRLAPPTFPVAFAQGGQLALADIEGSIGMFQSNLGAPNNSSSGRQERERKEQGATATYHFMDNESRSIEHLGRIIVSMIPQVYDTKRQARILGLNGENSEVEIDPKGPAVRRDPQSRKIVAINPNVGSYDVRVQAGANYTTQRQEAADGLVEVLRGAPPEMAAVLIPQLVKLQDWPDSERVSRMLLALAPPQVQEIANESDDGGQEPIPPQVQAQMQQMQQQLQQMSQMMDAGEKELERLTAENEQMKAGQALNAQTKQLDAKQAAIDSALHKLELQKTQLGADKQAQDLELQFGKEVLQMQAAQQAEKESAQQASEAEPAVPAVVEMPDLKQAIDVLAQTLMQSQLQTQEALAQLAQAQAAPRQIVIQKDAAGRPIGAVSTALH